MTDKKLTEHVDNPNRLTDVGVEQIDNLLKEFKRKESTTYDD